MGSLIVRVANAARQPLPDTMDVRLLRAGDNSVVKEALGVSGVVDVVMQNLVDHQPYIVQVHSQRHRPVQQFAIPKPSGPIIVQVYCPLDPKQATAKFLPYELIPDDLRSVFELSVEVVPKQQVKPSNAAKVMFESLSDEQKAGLLNVYAKMAAVGVWQDVERITAVQSDRILCDVQESLLGAIRLTRGIFRKVSGSLHESPSGFGLGESFKTLDPYGNLQLTLFVSNDDPARLKLDADIDDAAGLTHVFHVIKHGLTNGKTHPYDIHEILVWQDVTLPYSLA